MQVLMMLFFMGITVGAYLLSRRLSLKYSNPLFNVILMSVSIVIATLLICRIPYSEYAPSGKILSLLLGPATVRWQCRCTGTGRPCAATLRQFWQAQSPAHCFQ